jgi:hypothetical protein
MFNDAIWFGLLRSIRFQQHYDKTAKPFEWTFTRRDLSTLLSKISGTSTSIAA